MHTSRTRVSFMFFFPLLGKIGGGGLTSSLQYLSPDHAIIFYGPLYGFVSLFANFIKLPSSPLSGVEKISNVNRLIKGMQNTYAKPSKPRIIHEEPLKVGDIFVFL